MSEPLKKSSGILPQLEVASEQLHVVHDLLVSIQGRLEGAQQASSKDLKKTDYPCPVQLPSLLKGQAIDLLLAAQNLEKLLF